MTLELDAIGLAAAAVALLAGFGSTVDSTGPARLLRLGVAGGVAVAVVGANAPLVAAGLLGAALAARVSRPEEAPAAAWAFLGDAIVAAGVGAAALDANVGDVAWATAEGAPAWIVPVVAGGVLVRLVAVGTADAPLLVVGATIGLRLAGLPMLGDVSVWMTAFVLVAVGFAWVGRPVEAVIALAWSVFGVPETHTIGSAAYAFAGIALLMPAVALMAADEPVQWGSRALRGRGLARPGSNQGCTGILAALALVPTGIGVITVPFADVPEAAPLALALVVVVALAARPGPMGGAESAGAVRVAVTVALAVPLVAPGWWADRLDVAAAARPVSDVLTSGRPGTALALAVMTTAVVVTWVSRPRAMPGSAAR